MADFQSFDAPEQPKPKQEKLIGPYDVAERAQRAYRQSEMLIQRMDDRVAKLRETDGRLYQQIGQTASAVLREKLGSVRTLIAKQIAEIERGRSELVQSYNTLMRGFSDAKPIEVDRRRLDEVDALIRGFEQRLERYESSGRLAAELQETSGAEQGLRVEQQRLQAKTEKMTINYERGLEGIRKRPNADREAEFLADAGVLLAQIQEEGRYMREHFRGEEETESRSIELMLRRTNVATEIANRTKGEKDVRTALDYARGELRWLKRNADQHEARIAQLEPLVQRFGEQYCDLLRLKTEASFEDPLKQQWQPIQREIMALEEYMPVTRKARIEELRQVANRLVEIDHGALEQKTNEALTDCDNLSVPEGTIRHALSMLRQEGVFLKKYGDRNNRFAYLQEQNAALSQKLAAMRGQALRAEATGLTAGSKDRTGHIETVQNLIDTEQRLGEGTNLRSREDVEALKQEQLAGLAQETDRLLIPAINSPERAPKMQALTVLVEEARLLFTHFLDSSVDRRSQLKAVAETLLRQIAGQTDVVAERCTVPAALEPHFREGFRLLREERTFLQSNRDLQRLSPDRLNRLQDTEMVLDSSLGRAMANAVERAVGTKTVADLDVAQQFLRLMEERAPFVVGDQSIVVTANLQSARRSLDMVRARSVEREGLERAESAIDVQAKIAEITTRLQRVAIDSPRTWQESNQREEMVAQLKKDMQILEENLPRATAAQRAQMQSLIAQIADASWEKLRTQEEKEKMFKQNFSLMVQEAKAKVAEMRQPLAGATLEKYTEIIKAGQAVKTKAQGYVDVAGDYHTDPEQTQALRDLMGDLTAEITRMQKIVATYKQGGAQRS